MSGMINRYLRLTERLRASPPVFRFAAVQEVASHPPSRPSFSVTQRGFLLRIYVVRANRRLGESPIKNPECLLFGPAIRGHK